VGMSCDTNTKWRRKENWRESVNGDRKKNAWLSRATRKPRSQSCWKSAT